VVYTEKKDIFEREFSEHPYFILFSKKKGGSGKLSPASFFTVFWFIDIEVRQVTSLVFFGYS
jgi:hypothetical protein